MSILICAMMGLPASGKTTFCSMLSQWLSKQNNPSIHVCHIAYDLLLPDSINYTGNGVENKETEKTWKSYRDDVFQLSRGIVTKLNRRLAVLGMSSHSNFHSNERTSPNQSDDILYNKIENYLHILYQKSLLCSCFQDESNMAPHSDAYHVLLIDDNMFYRSMRYSYYQLAREMNCSYSQIFLKISTENAIRRNSLRTDGRVTMDTILRMAELFEKPDREKFYWEENTYEVSSEAKNDQLNGLKNNFENIQAFLLQCFQTTVQPLLSEDELLSRQEDRETNLDNFYQFCDQFVRKEITRNLKVCTEEENMSKQQLQLRAKQLNYNKKVFLKALKTGCIVSLPHTACKCEDCQCKIVSILSDGLT